MSASAAVIIPTYGDAPFLRQAVASVQAQTVSDLEVCIISDGSPPEMISMIDQMAAEDERIEAFHNPKAARTGEIHRCRAIAETTAPVICYLGHDDLWLPHHAATMVRMLQKADFTHSMHVEMGLAADRFKPLLFHYADLELDVYKKAMLNLEKPRNFFGLTFGAHTRKAYEAVHEGWTTTPDGIWTDFYMWHKLLKNPGCRSASHMGVTALHFEKKYWSGLMSSQEYAEELDLYLTKMQSDDFLQDLNSAAFKNLIRSKPYQTFMHLKEFVRKAVYKPRRWINQKLSPDHKS